MVFAQQVYITSNPYTEISKLIKDKHIKSIFLVCGRNVSKLSIGEFFQQLSHQYRITWFRDYEPNPKYESVVMGVQAFKENKCDVIFAVGGGSALDVAKCVKLFVGLDSSRSFLEQDYADSYIPLWVMPTTAGTGSEATRFAVIYYQGIKQSISHQCIIPDSVFFDASLLKNLPMYHRKATALDALCHALESFWSINSTEESKRYSREAIVLFLKSFQEYMENTHSGNVNMLKVANLAGKAINITQTTAGHALAYKLTSLYGYAHGHAVALVDSVLWPFMEKHTEKCLDARGEEYLKGIFSELFELFVYKNVHGAGAFQVLLKDLKFVIPAISMKALEELSSSVNPIRLKNNPILLKTEDIQNLYKGMEEN